MDTSNHHFLIAGKVVEFNPGEADFKVLSAYRKVINDDRYFHFIIESENAGFFFERSLQLYSYSSDFEFNDIEKLNFLMHEQYGQVAMGLTSFGQDVFGNQFCFDSDLASIILFNSETGERELLAQNFNEWVDLIFKDLEYYTGINVLHSWTINDELNYDCRLYPKITFVIGGKFSVNNLYSFKYPQFLRAYANIATQIFYLPEGTPVKLTTEAR